MTLRVVAATLVATLLSQSLWACAPFIYVPHHTRPEERATDRHRPRPPAAELTLISRAEPETTIEGDVVTINTCGGTAYALVHIESTDLDETSPAAEIGFRWKVVGGRHVPKGLTTEPEVQRLPSNQLAVVWAEPDGKHEVDFEIVVMAVDRAGNVSRKSRVVRVYHRGS
jgi:hypothetical protein